MCICVYVCMCVCVYVYMCICVYVCICICVYVYMCICVYVDVYVYPTRISKRFPSPFSLFQRHLLKTRQGTQGADGEDVAVSVGHGKRGHGHAFPQLAPLCGPATPRAGEGEV